MYSNKEVINKFEPLTFEELRTINGGGLIEDIGYAAHWVKDKTCQAYHKVKDTVSGWFE